LKHKIDFPEFFILAQKLLHANFKEVSTLNEKYDSKNEGYFSLKMFVEDINKYRMDNSQPI